jgi:hypothetical protein
MAPRASGMPPLGRRSWYCAGTAQSYGPAYSAKLLLQLQHALATGVFITALIGFFGIGYLIHRYEERLIDIAERELPGPWSG